MLDLSVHVDVDGTMVQYTTQKWTRMVMASMVMLVCDLGGEKEIWAAIRIAMAMAMCRFMRG
jgi:hypothetical protein